MLGLSAALTFIKSIPGMILTALVVAVIGYAVFLKIENGSLSTSLAKTQAAVATLKQSNTSLELDNKKKQQEFDAAIAEQQNITKKDADLANKAKAARDEAARLSAQKDAVMATDPDEFVRQVNRDIGCDFQGFGNAINCDTVTPANPALEKK